MTAAKSGDHVTVHYKGTLKDGTVFDTSENREPLSFQLGQGNMIKGFEQAVEGMSVGETRTAEMSVDEAYGPVREDMIVVLERSDIPTDIQPEVGQQLALQHPEGHSIPVTVTEVSAEQVTLDANHPLAGKDLVFEIKLLEIGQG